MQQSNPSISPIDLVERVLKVAALPRTSNDRDYNNYIIAQIRCQIDNARMSASLPKSLHAETINPAHYARNAFWGVVELAGLMGLKTPISDLINEYTKMYGDLRLPELNV